MFDFCTRFDITLEQLIYDCENGNEEGTLVFMPDGMIDLETLGEKASQLRYSLWEYTTRRISWENFIEAVEVSGMFDDHFIEGLRY